MMGDVIEIIGLLAASLTTASFIPQVLKLHKEKSTKAISLTMYSVFFVGIILWLVYGVYRNSMPIIFANSITAFLVGYIIYLKLKHT